MEEVLSLVNNSSMQQGRNSLQMTLMDIIDDLDKVKSTTQRYRQVVLEGFKDKPYRISPDRLEGLYPYERIEIRKMNRSKEILYDGVKNESRHFFLEKLGNLFTVHLEKVHTPEFLELVKEWLDIFEIHFELGYYHENEFVQTLRIMKSTLKILNQINVKSFVLFLASYVRRFIKSALFMLVDKITIELSQVHKKIGGLLDTIIEADFDAFSSVNKGLSFGELIDFFKNVSKRKYNILEEEINMLEEIYFNNCIGICQLKSNFDIDWELMDNDLVLQEYFFNIRDDLFHQESLTKKVQDGGLSDKKLVKVHQIRDLCHRSIEYNNENMYFGSKGDLGGDEDIKPPKATKKIESDRNPAEDRLGLLGSFNILSFSSPGSPNTPNQEAKSPRSELNEDIACKMFMIVAENMKIDVSHSLRDLLRSKSKFSKQKELPESPFHFLIEVGPLVKCVTDVLVKNLKNEDEPSSYSALAPLVGTVVLTQNLILCCYSNEEILELIRSIPAESFNVLANAKPDKIYLPLLNDIIETSLSWLISNTQEWANLISEERTEVLRVLCDIMTFLNGMIELRRSEGPGKFENELVYFDFLCFMVSTTNSLTYLKNALNSEDENLIPFEKNYFELLFKSLAMASEQYFITEFSDMISELMPELILAMIDYSGKISQKENIIDEGREILIDCTATVFPALNATDIHGGWNYNSRGLEEYKETSANDKQFEKELFILTFPHIATLQLHIIFSRDETLLDRESYDEMIKTHNTLPILLNNLQLLASPPFVDIFKQATTRKIALDCITAVFKQAIMFLRRVKMSDASKSRRDINRGMIDFLHNAVIYLVECLDLAKSDHFKVNETIAADENDAIEDTLDAIIRVSNKLELDIKLTDFRRVSVHYDEENLRIMRAATKLSCQYTTDKTISLYYKHIFEGQVEMEIDPKELYNGLARHFLKTMNKMMFNDNDYHRKFKKLETNLREFCEANFEVFSKPTDNNLRIRRCIQTFVRTKRTSYYHNDRFTRTILLYEKLFDELRYLKEYVYHEALKNKLIVSFFSSTPFADSYPFLRSMYQLSFALTHSMQKAYMHTSRWGVLISRFFVLLSLLENICQGNYHVFKKIYGKTLYVDPTDHFYSEVIDGKEDKDELRGLEVHSPCFITSICLRVQRFFANLNCDSKYKVKGVFSDQSVTSNLTVVTMWINFLDSCSYDRLPEVKRYILYKLYTRYLYTILFYYDEVANIDMTYLKKAIAALLFTIGKDEEVLSSLVKYHYDLKFIYDYTLLQAKMHVWTISKMQNSLLKMMSLKKKKAKKEEKSSVKASNEESNSVMGLSRLISVFSVLAKENKFRVIKDTDFSKEIRNPRTLKMDRELFGGGINAYKEKDFVRDEFDEMDDMDVDQMIDIYKKSDNKDLGFQLIHSLIKIMNAMECKLGFHFWSTRKEVARVYFEVEESKLPKSRVFELKMVYFLSQITKQIEIIDDQGRNILVSFRKYPAIYTLEDLNPLVIVKNFDVEDFKRDMAKVILDLYIQCNIQYSIMQSSGFMYQTLKSDSLSKYPKILWGLSLCLNGVVMFGYENSAYQSNTHKFKDKTYIILEKVLSYLIMAMSFILTCFWLYTRVKVISLSRRIANERGGSESSISVNNRQNSVGKRGPLQFIFDNPYFKLLMNIVLQEAALSLFLHLVWAALGTFVHPVYYSFGILMFAFFNTTTQNLLRAVTTNGKEIILTLVLMLMVIYILTTIEYFYFFDQFDNDIFDTNRPCSSLYACYLNMVSYGLRYGGGIGENLSYVREDNPYWIGKIMTDLAFFFFLNMIAMNIVFGIIIDTFGQLRDIESIRVEYLSNYCLVCGVAKTEFEAQGINFFYHTNIEHNIEDYISYMIRLYINAKNLFYDIDYLIFEYVNKLNISWFPGDNTLFLSK